MVEDIRAAVINESVRRMVNECMDCPSLEYTIPGLAQEFIDPEQIRRMAALNQAMARIARSTSLN